MRIFYLFDDISAVEHITDHLHRHAVKDSRIHVFSADEAGLYKYHLHSATPLQTRELIRFGEEGALIGLAIGAVLAAALVYSLDFLRQMPGVSFAVITLVIAAHGAWIGGMVGLATINRRVRKFLPDIRAGRYLVMVDIPRARAPELIESIRSRFHQEPREESRSVPLPFTS